MRWPKGFTPPKSPQVDWEQLFANVNQDNSSWLDPSAGGKLRQVADFGVNPGGLAMFTHVPETLPANAPLVVVLHGCGQSAAAYDRGAGWSTLADRFGFVVLAPEQNRTKHLNGCFNWFLPGDTTRGGGEAASIRQMVAHAVATHGLDPQRVYVTGLSAGGGMTSAMLAAYPEVFAGGAIIAGLPYGAASTVQ
ncbi:MAG: PHB depolymerase family esterase, partial [Caulobacteraceae bacterium]